MVFDVHRETAFTSDRISDDQFYRLVRRHGRLARDDEARAVTRHVFASLSASLNPKLIDELQRCLPPTPAADLEAQDRHGYYHYVDYAMEEFARELFIGPLVNTMDTVGVYDETLGGMDLVSAYLDDDAAMRVQAVFLAVKACCGADLAADMMNGLPPEVSDWFRDATRS